MATSRDRFGGHWSDAKLDAVSAYLSAYTTALKNFSFKKIYIDAFAGAGGHFEFNEDDETTSFRHGSPLLALEATPAFDEFRFIEKDESSLWRLRKQIEEQGYNRSNIRFHLGDANQKLLTICRDPVFWKSHRAVAFLDPFALQIQWETIRAIAKTEAIDMWLLFPAMAVNRMMTRSGSIDPKWEERLTETFGSSNWKDVFYDTEDPDLFGFEKTSKREKPFEILSRFVTSRLNEEFAGATDEPLVLRNSSNTPIFLLCFACGNKKGAKTALRIANHIIQKQL